MSDKCGIGPVARNRLLSVWLGGILAAAVMSCGSGDSSARHLLPGSASRPLPGNAVSTFELTEIHDANVEGKLGDPLRLYVHNELAPLLFTWTPCGTANSSLVEIADDRIIVTEFVTERLDPSECTADEFAAATQLAAMLTSSPVYDFDGASLKISDGEGTATMTLIDVRIGGS